MESVTNSPVQLEAFDRAFNDLEALCPILTGDSLATYGLKLGELSLGHRRLLDATDRALEKLRGLGRDILELARQGYPVLVATVARIYLITAPLDAANYAVLQGDVQDHLSNWLEVASLNQLADDMLTIRVLAQRAATWSMPNDIFLVYFARVDAQITECQVGGLLSRPSGRVKALYGPDRAGLIDALLQQPISPLTGLLHLKIALYRDFRAKRDSLFALVPILKGEGQVEYALRISRTRLEDPERSAQFKSAKADTLASGMAFLGPMFAALPLLKIHEKRWLNGPGYCELCNVYIHTLALAPAPKGAGFADWLGVAASLLASGDPYSYVFLADLAAVRRGVKTLDDDPLPTKDVNDLLSHIRDSPALEGLARESAALKKLFADLAPLA